MTLLAVPNLSEGRDFTVLDRLQVSLGGEVSLLDVHTDVDHNRAVFTVAGDGGELSRSMPALATAAAREIGMGEWEGLHPAIGALDVCPVVWVEPSDRELAIDTARDLARAIGDSGIPVFLYGALASGPDRVERAFFRSGGIDRLWERMVAGGLVPDFGPDRPHPRAGATLVTARPPLAAFNLELASDDLELARRIAGAVREGPEGSGLPGVRAIGLELSTGRTQVSVNVHDPLEVPLARLVEAVRIRASEAGTRVVGAELIGLVPEGALAGYPEDLPIRDFSPALRVIERRLDQS